LEAKTGPLSNSKPGTPEPTKQVVQSLSPSVPSLVD